MTEHPIPVLLVATGRLDVGGVEAHLLSLPRGDAARAFRWHLAAPMSDRFAAALRQAGGEAIPWQTRGRFDRAAVAHLSALINERGIRLVHTHDSRALLLGGWAARRRRTPVVATVHLPAYFYDGIRGRRPQDWLYRRVEAFTLHRLTDHVIYVATSVLRDAIASGVAPVARAEVIENGIDLAALRAAADAAPDPPLPALAAGPVLLFVGRLAKQKGVDLLLRAVQQLAGDGRAFSLLIAGDGPLRPALEQQADALGVAARVRFLGMRGDIPALLRRADLYVLPSRYEGLPIGLLEALAVGVPCVVTDVNEHAVVIRDGREGLVVPPEDPAALASALETLLADAPRRAAMAASATARAERYSLDRMCARIFRCYRDLLSTLETPR